MLDWFKTVEKKEEKRFIKFDIVSFYPSIKRELLDEAIQWSRQLGVEVSELDESLILASRQNFLWYKNHPWKKKEEPKFDCTMGSFDSAEVAELVGLFVLHKITSSEIGIRKEEVGLYRDDGLAILRRSKRELDNIRKKFHELFRPLGLRITMITGMETTDFLDVTLHLKQAAFEPFRKEETPPTYINKRSNHPDIITKNLPAMIEKKLNDRCSNLTMFNKHKTLYEGALAKSGHRTTLTYNPEKPEAGQKRKKPRYPNIFWFNPPFNLKIATNVGREFLTLLDKNFPKGTTWHRHFNRHTVKLSYSCTPNIAKLISAHNQKVLNSNLETSDPGCNCSNGPCPVEGKCLTEGLVYRGTMTWKQDNFTYTGSTGNSFKERYSGHKQDLRNENRPGTTLSNKFWQLKREDPSENPTITWKIINKCHKLRAGIPCCDVCLTEKTRLLLQHKGPSPKPPDNTIFLNKRTEIYAKCRHRRKFTLRHCNNLYSNQSRGHN